MKMVSRSNDDELTTAHKRLRSSKYVLFLALLLWPLGIFIHPAACFIIFLLLFALWSVLTYISYMHYLAIKRRSAEKQR